MGMSDGRRRIPWWWGFALAIFFVGLSFMEIKALNPKDISLFERIFWWTLLILWAFSGSLVIIIKVRERDKNKRK